MKKHLVFRVYSVLAVFVFSPAAFSQTTEFVYQGQLQASSGPAAKN